MSGWLILGAAAIGAASTPMAPAEQNEVRAWPAMRQAGAAYAVVTDDANRITRCLPLDPAAGADKTSAACAALTARGIPASVVPALAPGNPDLWFTAADYPVDAIPRRASGNVTLLYEVNEQGKVANCMVYRSSGIDKLDQAACRAIIFRAHFTPASYNGKPVHAAATATFSFASE